MDNNNADADHDTDDQSEQIDSTILEFLSTFHHVTEPQSMDDLFDGVALFEALSEIAPDYFDHTTIARHLGDNWALKNSNLRKMLRNVEQYYHSVLHRDYDNGNWSSIDLQTMARTNDRTILLTVCQLVIGAAVTCPEKQIYIQRIMEHMEPDTQVVMKSLIQQSLSKLTEYKNDNDEDDEEDDYDNNHNSEYNDESGNQEGDDENELVFGESTDENNFTRNDLDRMQGPTKLFHSAKKSGVGTTVKSGHSDGNNVQQQLDDVVRELASMKVQATIATEENQKSESKLSTLIEDLQDRLMKRQDELIQVEEELKDAVTELEETKSKLSQTESDKASLEDDLDVMRSKAQQLHKAEATVVAYKKKLESLGTMNQQMEDLEDQAEKYLRQIMTLESEVKKSNALQKTVTAHEESIRKLEKTIQEYAATAKTTSTEIADLKSRLSAAESTKKMYEDELNELRMKQQHLDDTAAAAEQQQQQLHSISNAASNTNTMNSDQREKMMRLEIENQQLRERLSQHENTTSTAAAATTTTTASKLDAGAATTTDTTETTPFAVAVHASVAASDTAVMDGFKAEIQRLTEAFTMKEQENLKIASDKDKLEAYTKRTLAKFQDKYLVALQECKAKLKEKQDKIELLEKRSQNERNVQKREERLLSSTIYELGLGIMQTKLKNTTASGGTTIATMASSSTSSSKT